MEMLRKITDCESFQSSQENISDGVYFSAVASLQRVDCTSNINRFCNRLFSKNVPKTNCLIRTFWKSSYCDVLKKRGPPIHSLQFYQNRSSRYTWPNSFDLQGFSGMGSAKYHFLKFWANFSKVLLLFLLYRTL